MRILFLSDNFPPESNAPATRLWEHATRWVRDGHEVTVITCAPNFPEGRLFDGYRNAWRAVEVLDGIRVVRVKTYITANEGFVRRTLDYMSFMVMAFVMSLFERKPDVVVATSPQFFCAIAGWAVSVFKRRPFVFELRDLWPASIFAVGAMKQNSSAGRILEGIELFLYRRAAAIVSVTESFREDLVSRGIAREKIEVVINGVDLDRYQPRDRDSSFESEYGLGGKFVAGYIGTHGMAHALPRVLEAAERLWHREDIVFLFAGAGAERATVEDIVRQRKLSNVRLVPRQPKERMPSLWSVCDLALVPLRDDPVFATVIPSKIFEAMGMGVPILMSIPEGEATAIVRRTGNGVCVAPENPQAMAQAVERLASAPDEVRELRRAARQGGPLFSRDVLARRMLGILEQVADRHRDVGS
jgi:colanic acid biosynthesis glycosyl transferase WcaI